jgi:hypothetical protein
MTTKKHPKRVNDLVRPKFGMPALLGQSDRVAEAFGPEKGYRLMVYAIVAWVVIYLGTIAIAGKGIAHIAGW